QSAFQTSGVVVAAAHDQERLLLVKVLCQLLHFIIQLEHLLDLKPTWEPVQTLNDLATTWPHGDAVFAHHQGKHHEGDELACVCL
ncbi:unnamed protein product, partial [Ixodes pacificus]